MSKSANALFKFGLIRALFIPHNADKTRALPTNLIGNSGDMDFSGAAAPAAVEGTIRVDGVVIGTIEADLDDAAIAIAAVTPTEWVAAVTAALAAHSPAITGFTPSLEAVTGRCKFVKAAAATLVEVYGDLFEMAGFGQGYGVKAIVCEELESSTPTPIRKEDSEIVQTNSSGVDTSVTVKGYDKGINAVVVDNSCDYTLHALIEGGTIDANGGYLKPNPTASKAAPSFEMWALCKNYEQGENLENDFVGIELAKYYKGQGSVSAGASNNGFNKFTYNLGFKNYLTGGSAEFRNLDSGTDAALIAVLEAI